MNKREKEEETTREIPAFTCLGVTLPEAAIAGKKAKKSEYSSQMITTDNLTQHNFPWLYGKLSQRYRLWIRLLLLQASVVSFFLLFLLRFSAVSKYPIFQILRLEAFIMVTISQNSVITCSFTLKVELVVEDHLFCIREQTASSLSWGEEVAAVKYGLVAYLPIQS